MKVFQIKSPDGPLTKIMVRSKCDIRFFNLSEVVYCSADRNYTKLHLVNGESCLCCICLSKVAGMLSKFGFCMVHKSYLINAMHIMALSTGAKYKLKLSNGSEITVTLPKKTILGYLLNGG